MKTFLSINILACILLLGCSDSEPTDRQGFIVEEIWHEEKSEPFGRASFTTDGETLILSYNDRIVAKSLETFEDRWTAETPNTVGATVSVSNDQILIQSGPDTLEIRNVSDGHVTKTIMLEKELSIGAAGVRYPPVIGDTHLFFTNDKLSKVYCLNLDNESIVEVFDYTKAVSEEPDQFAPSHSPRVRVLAAHGNQVLFVAGAKLTIISTDALSPNRIDCPLSFTGDFCFGLDDTKLWIQTNEKRFGIIDISLKAPAFKLVPGDAAVRGNFGFLAGRLEAVVNIQRRGKDRPSTIFVENFDGSGHEEIQFPQAIIGWKFHQNGRLIVNSLFRVAVYQISRTP